MLESTLSIPVIQISHDKKCDFRRSFLMLHEDESFLNLSVINPIFQIFKKDGLIEISGADITITDDNEFFLVKDKSFFSELSCMEDYHFRFSDQESDTVFVYGPFKILA